MFLSGGSGKCISLDGAIEGNNIVFYISQYPEGIVE